MGILGTNSSFLSKLQFFFFNFNHSRRYHDSSYFEIEYMMRQMTHTMILVKITSNITTQIINHDIFLETTITTQS